MNASFLHRPYQSLHSCTEVVLTLVTLVVPGIFLALLAALIGALIMTGGNVSQVLR